MQQRRDRHDEALRVLRKVRDLLSDRNKWIAGHLAVDARGDSVHSTQPQAVRFCAAGAINRITHREFRRNDVRSEVELAAVNLLSKALNAHRFSSRDIPHVNDGANGYERIMAGLAKAIGVSPKRREAALKGWKTRRQRAFDRQYQEWLRAREAESVDPRPEVMAFGGTITVSPVTTRELVTTK